jgi:hypothetical protein
LKYKINITSCHGCDDCIFTQSKDLKKVLKNGELLVESESILEVNCDAVEQIQG